METTTPHATDPFTRVIAWIEQRRRPVCRRSISPGCSPRAWAAARRLCDKPDLGLVDLAFD